MTKKNYSFINPTNLGLFLGIMICSCGNLDDDHNTQGWWEYGGRADQSKYVSASEIQPGNVATLEVTWSYPVNDDISYQFNPIIVDTIMYVMAQNNALVALNAETGKELWVHANLAGMTRKGVNYWESADRKDRRLLLTIRNTLQAIDAQTGLPILSFGDKGIASLNQGLGIDPALVGRSQPTTPGRIFEDLIILGSSPGEGWFSAPGHLRAFNVVTGKLEWVFHTIPKPGEYGYNTWPKDAFKYVGGVNVWGEISLDEKRGIAYFPLGAPTYDYYGADRKGENLYGNCILALDARTGKRIWHFQTVHHDIWDYDLATAPQLISVNHDGKRIDAVAQATKQGFLFVLDRLTGIPLWPIEERAVPPSTVPGEHAWPTQPFPTVIPPFNRQQVTTADISDILLNSSEYHAVVNRVANAATGLYTPLQLGRETVSSPGAVGGANWGNSAANPDKGIVYIMSQDFASFYRLEAAIPKPPKAAVSENSALIQKGLSIYNTYCRSCHAQDAVGQLGPQLIQIEKKMSYPKFKAIIETGQGQMPAFQHIDENSTKAIYTYLNGLVSKQKKSEIIPEKTSKNNLIVAQNAAFDQHPNKEFVNKRSGASYPAGVMDTPINRYITGYGLELPHALTPPWSFIVAYDLNTGTIKWKVPLGIDPNAAKKGYMNTGVPNGSQRKGMIVTSSGLLFATANDGRIYAYDSQTGAILWKFDLPLTSEALPSFYSIKGKDYLVVNATTKQPLSYQSSQNVEKQKEGKGAYLVFSLPQKNKNDE